MAVIRPISSLKVETKDWAIKVRVTKVGQQKRFMRGISESVLVPLEFIDEQGTQITAALFGEAINTYKHILRIGKCYKISGGMLREANKKYSTSKCELTITLDINSSIEEINDNDRIPRNVFNFIEFVDIMGLDIGTYIEVIGIAREISAPLPIKFRDGKPSYKRSLKLYNEKGKSIDVALWRHLATMDIKNNDVIAFKGIRVNQYNQYKQLSSVNDTLIFINLNHPKVRELMDWARKNPRITKIVSRPIRSIVVIPFL